MVKLIHSKKAIGVGQVFVFIIAALAFSLIMIFGYQTIRDFLDSGEKVQFAQFQNDLQSSIKKIYTEFSAVRVEKYQMPSKYQQICFVDLDYPAEDKDIEDLCKVNPVACTAWESLKSSLTGEDRYSKYDENVFLSPISTAKIKVYRLSIANDPATNKPRGYLCQKISNGAFSLVLEGKGDHTEISEQNHTLKEMN